VAKAGTANLHEIKMDDYLPPEAKKVFGEKAVLAIAFDKTAVYAGLGPDARAKVTSAVAAKPTGAGTGPTTLIDLSYTPAKIQKLIKAIDERAAGIQALGNEDELQPIYRTTVAGGTKLTVTQTMTLKVYGWMFLGFRAGR
jgi:hypothetical protein